MQSVAGMFGLTHESVNLFPALMTSYVVPNSKHWFTTSFLQTTAIVDYAMGLEKLSANEKN